VLNSDKLVAFVSGGWRVCISDFCIDRTVSQPAWITVANKLVGITPVDSFFVNVCQAVVMRPYKSCCHPMRVYCSITLRLVCSVSRCGDTVVVQLSAESASSR